MVGRLNQNLILLISKFFLLQEVITLREIKKNIRKSLSNDILKCFLENVQSINEKEIKFLKSLSDLKLIFQASNLDINDKHRVRESVLIFFHKILNKINVNFLLKQIDSTNFYQNIEIFYSSQYMPSTYIKILVSDAFTPFFYECLHNCNNIQQMSIKPFNQGVIFIPKEDLVPKNLTFLDLSNSYMSTVNIINLASLISKNSKIQELNLSSTHLKETDMGILFNMNLPINQTLEKINLSFNNIKNKGLINLVQYLTQNTSIIIIQLASIEISDDGFMPLFQLLGSRFFNFLDLGQNSCSDIAFSCLLKLLASDKNLFSLKLNDFFTDNSKFLSILKCLSGNSSLREIILNGNVISSKSLIGLIEFFKMNSFMSKIVLNNIAFDFDNVNKLFLGLDQINSQKFECYVGTSLFSKFDKNYFKNIEIRNSENSSKALQIQRFF
jgi:hypothetical protein